MRQQYAPFSGARDAGKNVTQVKMLNLLRHAAIDVMVKVEWRFQGFWARLESYLHAKNHAFASDHKDCDKRRNDGDYW